MQRWSVYRLTSIEPEPIIETLQDLGSLDPRTRLQADKKNHAILAYAPLADHVTIRSLIERLDGSARQFHVIHLKRLEAEYVAGTIDFMMSGERGDKKQQQRSRYSMYYPYDSFGSSSQKEESNDKFRVEPDIERNRIILWANPIELQEVQQLLEKLGENTGAGDSPTIRVMDLPAGKETDELLERIRRHWPSVSPNPLILPPPEQPKEKPTSASPKTEPPKTESPQPAAPPRGPPLGTSRHGRSAVRRPRRTGRHRGDHRHGRDAPRRAVHAACSARVSRPDRPAAGQRSGTAPKSRRSRRKIHPRRRLTRPRGSRARATPVPRPPSPIPRPRVP